MIFNGKEVQGYMLKDISKEEIRQKMNKEALIAFLDDVDAQSRRMEQWEKEHNF